ncbi:unnamed protein product [Vitrella brassicaformis CCMP3155]|uniref:Magnesium transporter n=2 Tax=Vitrella brassicaformis TaxID=1169539 RepID=A0A0G4EB94_VITBC|nr:unnamed protein product [Vitrella brassicaformis CCMP3155]|eukprot:CEL92769.1 unnamed protein product [Vitrella brassicaformis CCMP3155]
MFSSAATRHSNKGDARYFTSPSTDMLKQLRDLPRGGAPPKPAIYVGWVEKKDCEGGDESMTGLDIVPDIPMARPDLAKRLGVPVQEVRLVDPSLQDHMPTIFVRPNAILLRFGKVNAIITHCKLAVFKRHAMKYSYLPSLKYGADPAEAVLAGVEMTLKSSLDEDVAERDDYDESGGQTTATRPFEFLCLEVCMSEALKSYVEDVQHLKVAVDSHLKQQNDQAMPSLETLQELTQVKTELANVERFIRAMKGAVENVLREDEDMAAMYLSETAINQPRAKSAHQEVEILFEIYQGSLEELTSDVQKMKKDIDYSEEMMKVRLDMTRNEIMQLELRISIMSVSLALAAVGTGAFGMNLTSHIEEHPYAFYTVSAAFACTSAFSYVLLTFLCKRRGLLGRALRLWTPKPSWSPGMF